MCGIVGFITGYSNGLTAQEADCFTDMLFLDTLRGWDSTGVFGVTNTGNVYMAKEASHGADFINKPEYKDVRQKMIRNGMFFVGHNRAATRGTVKDENAHPFWIDDKVVLVQNGTMRGDHKKFKDVEVDTEALAHVITGSESVEEALNKVDAAYALVWYDVENKKLNIIRNNDRPLYLATTKSGAVVFASEANTILYSGARNNIQWDDKPYMLEKDTLVTYEINKDKKWEEQVTEVKIKPKTYYESEGYSNFHRGRGNNAAHGGTSTSCGGDDSPFVHGGANRNSVSTAVQSAIAPINQGRLLPFASRNHTSGFGPRDISDPFYAVMMRDQTLRSKYSMDSARAHALDFLSSGNGPNTIVKVVDYFPCNAHKDCKTWHICAVPVDPKADTVLYHWFERDTDELKILDIALKEPVYRVLNPGTYKSHFYMEGGVRKGMVASFVLEKEEVLVQVETKNVH